MTPREIAFRTGWTEGPPLGAGRWWVYAPRALDAPLAVDIGPALINRDKPNPPLLIKLLGGSAFDFDSFRDLITHHAALVAPEPPR